MWRKINVTKRRSKGKWDEGHEREREWSKYQRNNLKVKGTVPIYIGLLISVSNYTHLKLRGQKIDPFMGSISFNPYRGQINHDLGHFL